MQTMDQGPRRDYRKLHIVTTENGIIISYHMILPMHDAMMHQYLSKYGGTLPYGSGHVMLDTAYLSRNICTLIEKTGRIPVIMPRKSVRVRGFGAMGKDGIVTILMNFYQYTINATTETTFSSMRRRFSSTQCP